jgi:hypothetical protein
VISRTLTQLRTKVRQRADMENTAFVSDSEVNDAINLAARSLFAALIQAYGEGHFESTTTFSTVAGTYSYSSALPSDFYRMLGMTAVVSGEEIDIARGNVEDMNRGDLLSVAWDDVDGVFYDLRGQTIRVSPTPSAVYTVTIRYVSANLFFTTGDTALVEMTADTDKIKLEELLWEDYVITHAAIRCMRKEQSDTSELKQDLAEVAGQISKSAVLRDQGSPSRIRMVD